MPRPVILGTLVGLCLAAAGARARTPAPPRAGKTTQGPPLEAEGAVIAIDDYAPITRSDGSRQWVFKSRDLYRVAQDMAPCDIDGGEVLNRAWSIAKPK